MRLRGPVDILRDSVVFYSPGVIESVARLFRGEGLLCAVQENPPRLKSLRDNASDGSFCSAILQDGIFRIKHMPAQSARCGTQMCVLTQTL